MYLLKRVNQKALSGKEKSRTKMPFCPVINADLMTAVSLSERAVEYAPLRCSNVGAAAAAYLMTHPPSHRITRAGGVTAEVWPPPAT